jgi:hypothetical protein
LLLPKWMRVAADRVESFSQNFNRSAQRFDDAIHGIPCSVKSVVLTADGWRAASRALFRFTFFVSPRVWLAPAVLLRPARTLHRRAQWRSSEDDQSHEDASVQVRSGDAVDRHASCRRIGAEGCSSQVEPAAALQATMTRLGGASCNQLEMQAPPTQQTAPSRGQLCSPLRGRSSVPIDISGKEPDFRRLSVMPGHGSANRPTAVRSGLASGHRCTA